MSTLASSRRAAPRAGGFTLFEMMVTMLIFLLLAAAVFGLMIGVLQGSSTLQDNQNHRDEVSSLNAFLKKKLAELPANSTFFSYRRGDGEGLTQNGVIWGEDAMATAIDAKLQSNGLYTLRLASITPKDVSGPAAPLDTTLQTLVTEDNTSLNWTPLIRDVKQVNWKFEDADTSQWVDLWNNNSVKPNLVEFSMQVAGDLQPSTMDFWLPRITPVTLTIAAPTTNNPPSTNAP